MVHIYLAHVVIVAYSTIVMVYFKQKSYVVKSDSYKAEKSRIGTHIKVGIGE